MTSLHLWMLYNALIPPKTCFNFPPQWCRILQLCFCLQKWLIKTDSWRGLVARMRKARAAICSGAHLNLYCPPVSAQFTQEHLLCEKAPSVLGASKAPHLGHHSYTVPLHCDGNGTLNQCLSPSGFITRWQPIVAALRWQQVAVEGRGQEKVRQMVRRDDNGAISQRILHLWCDGGGCRGAFDARCDECIGWTYLSLTACVSLLIEMSRRPQQRALKTNFGTLCSTLSGI